MSRLLRNRHGAALIAVLVVLSVFAQVSITVASSSDTVRRASEFRRRSTIQRWQSAGCASRVLADLEARIEDAANPAVLERVWATLDERVREDQPPFHADCSVRLTPASGSLDVNVVGEPELRALLLRSDVSEPAVDSLVDALLDWRDEDDRARVHGAEREWYLSAQRPPPRNGRLVVDDELRLIRGWDQATRLRELLSIEAAPVVIDRAPRAILATLPGLSSGAIDWIDQHREVVRGRDISFAFDSFAANERDSLMSHYSELRQRTRSSPSTWWLEVSTAKQTSFRLVLQLMREGSSIRIRTRTEYAR